MRRSYVVAAACAALVSVAVAGLAARAGAEDEKGGPPPGGMPPPQKKIEHPLAKALLGSWSVAHKSTMDSTGTVKFALGLGGTAVIEDYEVGMGPMGTFHGHGVLKVTDDGKTLNLWWIDTHSAEPQSFTGPLTDKGFDVKSEDGTRLVLAQTATGFEFRLSMGDGPAMFTDTYTKK